MRLAIAAFGVWLAAQTNTDQTANLAIYTKKLLDAFAPPTSSPNGLSNAGTDKMPTIQSTIPHLVEPLTDREREVLRLVTAGFSNVAIAVQLVVSVGTVKTHLKHIYGKLAVESRTQAVAQARLLELL